jgi:hypothetical protein
LLRETRFKECKRFAKIRDHSMDRFAGSRIVPPDENAQTNSRLCAGFHVANFITQYHATSGIKPKV